MQQCFDNYNTIITLNALTRFTLLMPWFSVHFFVCLFFFFLHSSNETQSRGMWKKEKESERKLVQMHKNWLCASTNKSVTMKSSEKRTNGKQTTTKLCKKSRLDCAQLSKCVHYFKKCFRQMEIPSKLFNI